MTKLVDIPLDTDFSACQYVQANGIFGSGPTMAKGVKDRIEILGGVARLYLNVADADTASGVRSEIILGTFPNGTGEYWSTVDFKYDWDYTGVIAIGSWYATPDPGDGLKYVPIGYRIRNGCLVIQVPDKPPVEGIGSQVIATIPITRGRWYSLCTHVNLQPTTTGFREIFLDAAPIVRQFGVITAYSDAVGPYFKMGPYDGSHEKKLDAATLYLRNATMWSGNDGYQAVMGKLPMAPRRMLQV